MERQVMAQQAPIFCMGNRGEARAIYGGTANELSGSTNSESGKTAVVQRGSSATKRDSYFYRERTQNVGSKECATARLLKREARAGRQKIRALFWDSGTGTCYAPTSPIPAKKYRLIRVTRIGRLQLLVGQLRVFTRSSAKSFSSDLFFDHSCSSFRKFDSRSSFNGYTG